MRLTLRTLLAYLDDILSPAETKEIGEKIAASPQAAQLAERVRDVIRRRRLTAADPDGTGGLDPNLMSEYLDNALPANHVADIERICLESDVNLAEAAACHQILTLVLGEPVTVPGNLRERMYALGPEGAALNVPDAPPPSQKVRETNAREQMAAIRAAERPAAVPAAAGPSLESRLPDYLRKPPLWKRVLPWAVVALVAVLWIGFLVADRDLFGLRTADDEAPRNEQLVADNENHPANRAEHQPASDEAVVSPQAAPQPTQTGADDETTPPAVSVNPPPPDAETPLMNGDADQTTPSAPSESVPDESVAAVTPDGSNAEQPAEPSEPAANDAAVDADKAATSSGPAALALQDRRGVILYQEEESGRWYPIPNNEDPPEGAAVVVPPKFEATATIGELPLVFHILPGTRLQPLEPSPAAPSGIALSQGRVRVTTTDEQAENEESPATSPRMSLQLGQSLWRLEILQPETTFGIEAQPLKPTEEGQDLTGRTPQAIVYVPRGAVQIADATGSVQTVNAGGRAVLSPESNMPEGEAQFAPLADTAPETEPSETPAGVPVAARTPPTVLPLGFPGWLAPREPTPAAAKTAQTFAGVFLAGRPADESLLPEINNRYFFVARPAAATLALIGNVDGMLKTLRDANLRETRMAAFEGLRVWLGQSPERGAILRQHLQSIFARDRLVQILDRLLWGFDMEDARDAETSAELVSWLGHPLPVVRELAFYYVKRLAGRTFDYRPTLSPDRRSGSVTRWVNFVERNGGLVVAE